MRVGYRRRDGHLLFSCQKTGCDGNVDVYVPNEEGEYSKLRSACGECDAEHTLDVMINEDDDEFTDPSESGLRSGKGTGLLRRLFRDGK